MVFLEDLLCTRHCYIYSLNSHTSDEEAIIIPIPYLQTKELRKVTDYTGDLAGSSWDQHLGLWPTAVGAQQCAAAMGAWLVS